jgi:GT2 family glycosyltransferase
MSPHTPPKISVVIPIYGNAGNLDKLVAALQAQTLKPYEIILVDSSPKPLETPPPGTRLVKNPVDIALSWDYNLGAREARGDFILNMQQDCIPEDPQGLETMFRELGQPGRVSVVALVTLPEENFRQYNFWGQVLMARWVGRVRQGISGKFDLHRKDVYASIGFYDTERFHFAGEDMDLFMRLSEQGEVWVSDVEIIHYHFQSLKTTWVHLLKKHYQVAESFGALFRKWGFRLWRSPYASHWTHHLAKYLYVAMLALPFYPVTAGLLLLVGSNLSNIESWRVKSWKTPLLVFFNPLLFLVGFAGTVLGLATGHQRYSQNK